MKLRLIARCAVMSALHRDELAHDALDKTVRGAEPKRDTLGLKPAREVGMREGDRMVRLDRVGGLPPTSNTPSGATRGRPTGSSQQPSPYRKNPEENERDKSETTTTKRKLQSLLIMKK